MLLRPEGFDLGRGGDVGEGARPEGSYGVWLVGEGGLADRSPRRCGDSAAAGAAEVPPLGLEGVLTEYLSSRVCFGLRRRFSEPCSRRRDEKKSTTEGKHDSRQQ